MTLNKGGVGAVILISALTVLMEISGDQEVFPSSSPKGWEQQSVQGATPAHLSPGVLTDFTRHVVGALHERSSDVVIIHRDDDQRNQEVNQEDHD